MGRIIARFHAAGRGDTSFNSARAEVRRALSGRQRLSMFGESVEIIGNLFENSNFVLWDRLSSADRCACKRCRVVTGVVFLTDRGTRE